MPDEKEQQQIKAQDAENAKDPNHPAHPDHPHVRALSNPNIRHPHPLLLPFPHSLSLFSAARKLACD